MKSRLERNMKQSEILMGIGEFEFLNNLKKLLLILLDIELTRL